MKYAYDIGAADGRIYDYDIDREGNVNGASKPVVDTNVVNGSDIGLEEAKKAALAYLGLHENDVKFIKARKDYDDGVAVYDFEFAKGYEVKYSCEVVAANGYVKDAETEVARSFIDTIELIFELLFSVLFNR